MMFGQEFQKKKHCMKHSVKILLAVLAGWFTHTAFADTSSMFNPKNASIVVQAGGFDATQGQSQDIPINGLIGDQFTVTHTHANNFLLGLGYYVMGQSTSKVSMLYGVNAFYLAPTNVQGDVVQEHLFNNLSYHYSLTNYPVYLATKALIKASNAYNITLDLGVGPNFIDTNDFYETSLDGGQTIPDAFFSGNTSIALSATAGVGIQFQHVFGSHPLEIDYRFFYLGKGALKTISDQVPGALSTGNNYANAITISTTF